jgi:hypothetical protein
MRGVAAMQHSPQPGMRPKVRGRQLSTIGLDLSKALRQGKLSNTKE